jgi:Helix-turn-helix domain
MRKQPDIQADERMLTQRELADRWRCSLRTLQRWRSLGGGPGFVRLGGSIRYPIADVLSFENMNKNRGAR